MSSLSWLEPRGFWALLLLPALWWLPFWSRASLGSARRAWSVGLRSLSVCALSGALARPVQRVESHATSTVVLVDVSDSMSDASLADAQRFIETTRALAGESRLELVTFARTPRRVRLPKHGQPWSLARHVDGRATDIARAISLALGLLHEGMVPQVVLFSDGRETHGELLRAARALAARDVTLWVAPPRGAPPSELGVLDLQLPDSIRVGEPFVVRARVVTSTPLPMRARLLQNGVPNALDATRALSLPAGETTLSFRSLVRTSGKVRYRLELTPEGPDRLADNNSFERSAVVRGAPRVLYVEREREQAYALLDLLRAASFEVELRTPEQAPSSAAELSAFDFYILSDVPADAVSQAASSALTRYVTQGGGFMMAGGERAFGLGAYQGTPLEPLLAVSLSSTARREQASLALVLAIDKSGSMAGEKLERAKEAALATAEMLPQGSYLGVIGFDAQPEQVVRLAVTGPSSALARKLSTLASGGGTAIFPALDAAYAALSGVRARVKHVVVLTDGQTQEESLTEIARSMRADGITISTVGLGEEVNRGLLSELARLGSGRAYYTRDPSKVPRLFTEEAQLVARSLAVEERVRVRRVATADFLRGVPLEEAPPLRGYVATSARALPAQLLLTSERDEPLLARMRVGQGWSLAWTSDLKPRWAADWFQFRGFSRLLSQLIREHMRQEPEAPLPIETRLEGDTLHAFVDVLDSQARFVNGLTGALELIDDRGLGRTAELFQSAPGRYEAALALPELGTYALRARLESTSEADRPVVFASGSVSHSFPAEYRPPFAAAEELLEAAARRTHGGPLPPAPALLEAGARSASRPVERWPVLVWLTLGLFLLDVTVRRARWRRPSGGAAQRQGT